MITILIQLAILISVIAIVEIFKQFLKLNQMKLVHFISYIMMGILSFLLGKYLFYDFSNFTNTLSLSFFIIAFVALIYKKKDKNEA